MYLKPKLSTQLQNPLPFSSRTEQCLNGRSHMGVGMAIEVTTNFWIEEDAFQNDTMPSGVRETIKLWTQPGTSSEPSVGVIYGMGWDGMGVGVCVCVWRGAFGGDDKRIPSLWRHTGYSTLALCARGSQSTELWVQCVNPYPLPSLITSPGQLHASQDFCLQLETNEWGESMQPPEQPK